MAYPVPDDFEPDEDWFSMCSVIGKLYAAGANGQEIDRISLSTEAISRVVDISVLYPGGTNWIGHTSLVHHEGNFYFGTLTPFPLVANAANIYKLTSEGQYSVIAKGFNAVLGILFDQFGALYVLENFTGHPFPTPGTGDIIRVDPDGSRKIIASGLNLPTAMTFRPDGKLYVSNWGFGPHSTQGGGQILQISFTCENIQGGKME